MEPMEQALATLLDALKKYHLIRSFFSVLPLAAKRMPKAISI
jgi:hypothetical protein